MPPAECVGCHGPEELWHQMLRPASVVSERLAVDALDRRGSPGTTASPRQVRACNARFVGSVFGSADVSRLRFRGTGAM